MKASFRELYRKFIPIFFCCLLVTALTGIIFGLSDLLVKLPAIVTDSLIAIHQGAFLGDKLSPLYVLLISLGVFILGLKTVIEGKYSLLFQLAHPSIANLCRVIALILVIPLVLCVETGVAYRLGTDWFEIPDKQTKLFLSIHGGSSLGTFLGTMYILAVGLTLIGLAIFNWRTVTISTFGQKYIQQSLRQKFKKAYLAEDFVPNQNKQSTSDLNLIKASIAIGLIVFLSLLYYFTSTFIMAIAIMSIVSVMAATMMGKKSLRSWQDRQETFDKLHEQEVESSTLLRAIPDSMLQITQAGVCLSYMPAKEADCFILYGDIINKHLDEFLAPEIATGFINAIRLSLQTGSTQSFRFPVYVDSEAKYHEARAIAIGSSEALIMVRKIEETASALAEQAWKEFSVIDSADSIQLEPESELVRVLNIPLQNAESDRPSQILICFAIDEPETSDDSFSMIDDNLLHQIGELINSHLSSNTIFQLEGNNLAIIIQDRTMEEASLLVDNLRLDLNKFLADCWSIEDSRRTPVSSPIISDSKVSKADWEEERCSLIKIKISLLEVNFDGSQAIDLVDTAKVTCQMAKQKVNFKAFW